MKNLFIVIAFAISSFCYAQHNEIPTLNYYNPQANFQLVPTQNLWTFIKLDTRNGKMWQVQYSVDGNQGEVVLNDISLILKSDEEKPGRFILYPTSNLYNFLLLDQKLGVVYQAQWSTNPNNRGVIPISF